MCPVSSASSGNIPKMRLSLTEEAEDTGGFSGSWSREQGLRLEFGMEYEMGSVWGLSKPNGQGDLVMRENLAGEGGCTFSYKQGQRA